MPPLPLELVELIFTFTDKCPQTLKSCSLVCSHWRVSAQRELFTNSIIAIKNLDCLGSVTYESIVKNKHRSSLISFITQLRIFPSDRPTSFDPKWPRFVQLLMRVEKIFFSGNDGPADYKTIPAIFPVLRSPNLKSIHVDMKGFPLWLLPACVHVKELYWSRVAAPSLLTECPFPMDGLSSRDLQSISLVGHDLMISAFLTWLHEHQREFSTSKVEKVALYFLDNPPFLNSPFLPLRNVSDLTLRFNQDLLPIHYLDLDWLQKLQKLKLITSVNNDEWLDPLVSFFRLTSWLQKFLIAPSSKLQAVQLEILDETIYLANLPEGQRDTSEDILGINISTLCRRFSQIATVSVYFPWLVPDDAARIFAVCQTLRPEARFRCGPLAPDSLHVPPSQRDRRARQRRLTPAVQNRLTMIDSFSFSH